jgi:peptidoglycan/LPS O-acetylase OafA/YrhL
MKDSRASEARDPRRSRGGVSAGPTATSHGTGRYASIDLLKAVAIIEVIWIHAFYDFAFKAEPLIERLGFLTRPAVPAFFFASGFLTYSATAIDGAQMGRRFRRLLIPYAIASVLAFLMRGFLLHQRLTLSGMLFDLATGNAWGVYYYVAVLLSLILVTPILSRWPAVAYAAFPVLFVTGLMTEAWKIPIGAYLGMRSVFWSFRTPLRWWVFFFAGWLMRRHEAALTRLGPRRRRRISWAAFAVLGGAFLYRTLCLPPSPIQWSVATVQYAAIFAFIGGFVVSPSQAGGNSVVRWLGEATYPLYLYHFFFRAFVYAHMQAGTPRGVVAFCAGLCGALLVVTLGRRLLKSYSHVLLG